MNSGKNLQSRFSLVSNIFLIFIVVTGLLVTVSWLAGARIQDFLPGTATMKLNTALCFFLLASGVLGVKIYPSHRISRIIQLVTASLVLIISGLSLAEHISGYNLGIDQLLALDSVTIAINHPGRMSVATSLNFSLLALAVILQLSRRHRHVWLAQLISLSAMAFSMIALIGYFYGIIALYRISVFSSMAFLTATGFILLGHGVLSLNLNIGVLPPIFSMHSGGIVARRLLPAGVLFPFLVGWLLLWAVRQGYFQLEFGLALFATSNIIVFSLLIWVSTLILNRLDLKRSQTEEKLVASLQALKDHKTAIDEHAIVAITDAHGKITYVNDKFCAISKFPREELIGKDHRIINSGYHPKEFIGNLWSTISNGQIWRGELKNKAKDGTTYWVNTTIVPFLNAQGKPTQYLAIRADITEHKRLEHRLQEQLVRMDLLHQITRAIGARQDLQSIFQIVIRTVEEQLPLDFACICLYNSENDELTVTCVGKRSATLALELAMSEQSRIPIDQNGLSQCVQGQLVYEPDISAIDFPFPKRLAGGGLRSFVAAPLLVESQVFGVLIVARTQPDAFSSPDCEFLKQLSEHVALAAHQAQIYGALQQAYNDLRQSQHTVLQQERLRALGQMASGIAHDINNAISPIAIYSETLLEREPTISPKGREYLKVILKSIEDVAETVNRLREFYRPREPQLDLLPVQLNLAVKQVIELTQARWYDIAQERGIVIEVKTELCPDLPYVGGVESEFRDALVNLVLNAIDAMPNGGALILRTRVEASGVESMGSSSTPQVLLEVVDSGIGMDDETRRRCLEPFFTTKGERGTGLGLAMVFGMSKRNGVDIEIESTPGKGTLFRLIFQPISTNTSTIPVENPVKIDKRLSILIIDDDPLFTKSLLDSLEGDGHLVDMADGGQEGIDAFAAAHKRGKRYDVVITDLGMPRIDGRKVSAEIKNISPTTPIIMLTGWGQRMLSENQIPPNVDRVLSKPPKLRVLREALVACLNLHR